MSFTIDKDLLFEKLSLASKFTSNKIGSSTVLQGTLLKNDGKELQIFSTNLSSFFHTSIKIKGENKNNAIIEPRKILEFLNLIEPGDVVVELKKDKIILSQKKNQGDIFFNLSTRGFSDAAKNHRKRSIN